MTMEQKYTIYATDWAYKMTHNIRRLYTEEYYNKTMEEVNVIVADLKARRVQYHVVNSIGGIIMRG